MRRIRTFIAIDPGQHIRDRLVSLQESLLRAGATAKWVEPDNLHVTLLFLGEVESRAMPELCAAVGEALHGHASFPMTIEKTGCFPNARRPKVLWAGVGTGAPEVIAAHDAIEGPLLDLGCYRREERRFTPHITLGRVRSDDQSDALSAALARYADWKGGEISVKEIRVMGSELTPQGPVYTLLSRAKLS